MRRNSMMATRHAVPADHSDMIIATPPSTLSQPPEKTIEFPDNRLLISLCGAHDVNITHIEKSLHLQILRRGNCLSLIGGPENCDRGETLLNDLYHRIAQGRDISLAEIDAAIRLPLAGNRPETPGASHITTRKKSVEVRTEAQHDYVKALFANTLGFGIGPAGTGKTYLAVAVGVSMLLERQVDKIILSRPAVEAGERLGFLPGDMKEKVDPYMQPLYDALNDFLPAKQLQKMMEEKTIEIAPLAFMRGRTLANAFVLLDEAQNATTMQMKMFLTRLGEGSRMVITGDRSQIDLPRGVNSGLIEAEKVLKNVNGISFSYFTSKDVVRHPMVAKIIQAYEAAEQGGGDDKRA